MKSGTTSLLGKVRELCGSSNFRPYWVTKTSFGNSYQFWIGDPSAEVWYSEGNSESKIHFQSGLNELSFLFDHIICDSDIVFECGAHHGWTTLQMSRFLSAGKGTVHAFEPNKSNLAILDRNLKANDCHNVKANWAALSATSGTTRVYGKSNGSVVPKLNRKSIFSKRLLNRIYGVFDVPTITVDQYVTDTGVLPNLLKIDVEGFEYDVLRGATDTLATRPKIFLEIHTAELPLYNATVQGVLDLLHLDEYHVWLQADGMKPPHSVEGVSAKEITDRVHLFALPK